MVTISLISCLLTLRRLGSVGVGTIIAAVLVGTVLGFVTRLFGVKRDAILYPKGRISKEEFLNNSIKGNMLIYIHSNYKNYTG